MGWVSALLGQNSPVSQFVSSNQNAIRGFGSGLASGQNISDGLAAGARGAAAGAPADDAYATAQQDNAARLDAINQTEQFLHAKGYDDLVPLVKAGQGSVALTEAFKRMAPQAPIKGSPGDIFLDPNTLQQEAAIPAAPEKPTATQQEYDQAVKQGFKGTIVDYQNTIENGGTTVNVGGVGDAGGDQGPPPVGIGPDGLPDPQQQSAFLSTLDPGTASLIKGIINYQMDIGKVTSMRGNQRQLIAQLASQADPTFDMTQYAARAAMRKSITSGPYSQTLNSANLVIQHLDELTKAADALHNQGGIMTPLNMLTNAGKQMTGDPTITRFNEAKQAVGAELAKVFKGSGVSDVQSIDDWQKVFDAASSPEQLHQAVATAVTLLKSRIDTIQNQFQSAMGHPVNFSYLTPHSRKVLTDLGIDPTALDPASAATDAQPDASGSGDYKILGVE